MNEQQTAEYFRSILKMFQGTSPDQINSGMNDQIREAKKGLRAAEQKERWENQAKKIVADIQSGLEHLDERSEMENIITHGMIKKDSDGLPEYTDEGEALVQLMRKASDEIVRTSTSFDQMKSLASEIVPRVETIALHSILNLPEAQLSAINKIQKQIVEESIEQFRPAFTQEGVKKKDETSHAVYKKSIEQASEPANRASKDLIKALHPEFNQNEIKQKLQKISKVNVLDIYLAMQLLFGKDSGQYPDFDMDALKAHLDNPDNVAWLSDEKKSQMQSLYSESIGKERTLDDSDLLDFVVLLEAVHISWAASQIPRQKAGENRFNRDAYQQFPAIKVAFTRNGGYELSVLEVMKDVVHMDLNERFDEETEKDSDVIFVEAIEKAIAGRKLSEISSDEVVIPLNYELQVTEDDIRMMCESKPYDEQYTRRIQWDEGKIEGWEQAGRPHNWLPAECFINKHPNKLNGIAKGWTTADKPHNMINPLTGQRFETDSEGHPLNPHWRTMLKYGIPAGSGFYFNEGNGGNVEGDVTAQDPCIFRFHEVDGEMFFQVLVGVRTDDNARSYAFLGGMRDKSDTEKKGLSGNALKMMQALTATREAQEEGGVDLQNAPFLHIVNAEVIDPRLTLNTQVTTGVTAFFIEGDLDIAPELSEMKKVEWVTVTPQLLKAENMFATHEDLLKITLRRIYEEAKIVVDEKGRVCRIKQE